MREQLNLEGILRLTTCDHRLVRAQLFALERNTVLASTYTGLLVRNLEHSGSGYTYCREPYILRWFIHQCPALSITIVIYGIELSIVLITASIIGMMRTISCRIMHLIPCLVEFNDKLELLALIRGAHTMPIDRSLYWILRNELGTIKELHP